MATAMPEQSLDKKPIWLGLGLLGGAAIVLAIVLLVKLGSGGKEVAIAEPEVSPAIAAPAEPNTLPAVVTSAKPQTSAAVAAPAETKPLSAVAISTAPRSVGPTPREHLKEPAQQAEPRTGLPDAPSKEAAKSKPSADLAQLRLGDGRSGKRAGEHRWQELLSQFNDDIQGQVGRWTTILAIAEDTSRGRFRNNRRRT